MNPAFIVWPVLASAFGLFVLGAARTPDTLPATIADDTRQVLRWLLAVACWLPALARWLAVSLAPSAFASLVGWLRRIPWPLKRKRGTHARMEAAS